MAGNTLLDPLVRARLLERLAAPAAPTEPAAPELPDRLPPREAGVLGLIALGLNSREIASRHFVSEATVKTHISNRFLEDGRARTGPGGRPCVRARPDRNPRSASIGRGHSCAGNEYT